MTWKHSRFERAGDKAPAYSGEEPESELARRLAQHLQASIGLASEKAAACCWDGERVAVIRVFVGGTDSAGRPRNTVAIREKAGRADLFAGSCYALFHDDPMQEVVFPSASCRVIDEHRPPIYSTVAVALEKLSAGKRRGKLVLPTSVNPAEREAGDICWIVRALIALGDIPGSFIVARTRAVDESAWSAEDGWTLLLAQGAVAPAGNAATEAIARMVAAPEVKLERIDEMIPRLVSTPFPERIEAAIAVARALDEAVIAGDDGVPLLMLGPAESNAAELPMPAREAFRASVRSRVMGDRFERDRSSIRVFQGGALAARISLDPGGRSLEMIQSVLGDDARERMLPLFEEELSDRLIAQPEKVIDEVRRMPKGARREQLIALVARTLGREASLDLMVEGGPLDATMRSLAEIVSRWHDGSRQLQRPISAFTDAWMLQHAEALLAGAEAVSTGQQWAVRVGEAALRERFELQPRSLERIAPHFGVDEMLELLALSRARSEKLEALCVELWIAGKKKRARVPDRLPVPTVETIERHRADLASLPAHPVASEVEGAPRLWRWAANILAGAASLEDAEAALAGSPKDALRGLIQWPPMIEELCRRPELETELKGIAKIVGERISPWWQARRLLTGWETNHTDFFQRLTDMFEAGESGALREVAWSWIDVHQADRSWVRRLFDEAEQRPRLRARIAESLPPHLQLAAVEAGKLAFGAMFR